MANPTKIAVVLTAIDKMSAIVDNATNNAQKKLKELSQKKFIEGAGLMGSGGAILASLRGPMQAFEQLQTANTSLMVSMMDSTGQVDKNFQRVTTLAEQLGNKLPGSTSDFNILFQTMLQNGMQTENILNGVGKAAAYLAVDMKMPMEAAGEFAARMKLATGVADKDMMKLLDTISRLKTTGVGADEMSYAFSKATGTLKVLGLQGIEATNNIAPLLGILVKEMKGGEIAGTSLKNVLNAMLDTGKMEKMNAAANKLGITFNFFNKKGQFVGVDNMMSQLNKLNGLSPQKIKSVTDALTGGGGDSEALNIMITKGLNGYHKAVKEINSKASLDQKIGAQLGTIAALKESASGTFENLQATIGQGLSPALEQMLETLNKITEALQKFMKNNPEMTKMVSMAVALTGAFFMLGGAIRILQGITVAMKLLNITMNANVFMLIATAAILAISYIYAHWDQISKYFSDLWNNIKQSFNDAWDSIVKAWDGAVNFFKTIWENIKTEVNTKIDNIKKVLEKFDPKQWLMDKWAKLQTWFSDTWQKVKDSFSTGVGQVIKTLFGFTPIGLIYNNWASITDFFTKIWDNVKNVFNNVWDWLKGLGGKFYDAGSNIINQIWNGIKAMVNKPIEAIKDMAAKILGHFPQSPAKFGPLRYIHRIKVMENIADTIKHQPLTNKMKDVARQAMLPLQLTAESINPATIAQKMHTVANLDLKPFIGIGPSFGAMPQISPVNALQSGKANTGGNQGPAITNHFHINLSGSATKEDGKMIASELERRFKKLMDNYNSHRTRVSF